MPMRRVRRRIPRVPYVVSRWRREHPGQDIPDGHVFTQRWPVGPAAARRDQVISCPYRHARALRGTGEQVTKAEQAVAGKPRSSGTGSSSLTAALGA